MKNKLIIAAAGSGKTTFLVYEALKRRLGSVLITTYTQANEAEIRKKFIEINGSVPAHVTIQTWFSTLLQHGVRPYQGVFFDDTVRGMLLVNERSGLKYVTRSQKKVYYAEDDDPRKYYLTADFKIYSDKISKFAFRCNERTSGAIIERISKIFSHIFVDEVQDLAGYDLELLKLLMKSPSTTLFVGDPRQVTYLTHKERKYSKYEGRIKEFIQKECRKIPCDIDEDTLNLSYRNNSLICEYSSRLYPNFKPCVSGQGESRTGHDGIFLVRAEDVPYYLDKYSPVQLRDSARTKTYRQYKSLNFGESKGLTFDRVLVYPTEHFKRWINNNEYDLAPMSRSKFYVALTRARFSVGIVYDSPRNANSTGLRIFTV